jgi:DNA polymerase III delta prime subunit
MLLQIRDAVRHKVKTKMLLSGVSGSGKTTGALLIARGLCDSPKEILLIDTENRGEITANLFGSEGKYKYAEFPAPFSAQRFAQAVNESINAGFKVIIFDSITPFWQGEGGILEKKDSFGGTFDAWKKVSPDWKLLINTIIQSDIHIILTSRVKSEYVIEDVVNAQGRTTKSPKKVGLKEDFREGIEYELNVHLRIDLDHIARPEKDNTGVFETLYDRINIQHGQKLRQWCEEGIDFKPSVAEQPTPLLLPQPTQQPQYSAPALEKLAEFRQFADKEMLAKFEAWFAKNPDEVTLVKTLMSGLEKIAVKAETLAIMITNSDMALVDLMKTFSTYENRLLEHPKVKEVVNARQ